MGLFKILKNVGVALLRGATNQQRKAMNEMDNLGIPVRPGAREQIERQERFIQRNDLQRQRELMMQNQNKWNK